MKERLLSQASELCLKAKQLGAEHAEVFVMKERTQHIGVRNQSLEDFQVGEEYGLAIRTLTQGRLGFAFTSYQAPDLLDKIVAEAIQGSRKVDTDEHLLFAKSTETWPTLSLYDPSLLAVSTEAKIELTKAIEKIARAYDPRIQSSDGANYQDVMVESYLVNSYGLATHYQAAYCTAYVEVIAQGEPNESETGLGLAYGFHWEEIDPEKIGREAGKNAVSMLGGRTISTQRVPLFFDPLVASQFLGALAPLMSGEAVRKKRSLLQDRLGKIIASRAVTLIDDGLHPQGIASAPFDGEGVPHQTTPLIEQGELKSYLHNLYTAQYFRTASTGNAHRSSFKSIPEIQASNFYLRPGEETPATLYQQVGTGLLVSKVLGMHTVNPISGEFSVGAAGYWIEKGAIAYPVRGVTISGNLLDLLKGIEGVANDFRFYPFNGNCGSSTLAIAPFNVSGC